MTPFRSSILIFAIWGLRCMKFWLLVYFLVLSNMQKTAFQLFFLFLRGLPMWPSVKNRPFFNRRHATGKLLVFKIYFDNYLKVLSWVWTSFHFLGLNALWQDVVGLALVPFRQLDYYWSESRLLGVLCLWLLCHLSKWYTMYVAKMFNNNISDLPSSIVSQMNENQEFTLLGVHVHAVWVHIWSYWIRKYWAFVWTMSKQIIWRRKKYTNKHNAELQRKPSPAKQSNIL